MISKQIGNAVPVNLAWAVGRSLIRLLNEIQIKFPVKTEKYDDAVDEILMKQSGLIEKKDNKTQTSKVVKGCRQLNLFELYEEYSDHPIVALSDDECGYSLDSLSTDMTENMSVLVGYVKKDNELKFIDGSAKVYYSGKRFPSTVDLKNVKYFVPYMKGKGIRDLYVVKNIRVERYKEDELSENNEDYRLVFEVEHLCQLLTKFRMIDLEIWRTYSIKSISQLRRNPNIVD